MKKTFLILIFGAILCLSANSQTSTLTADQAKQVTDQVADKTGIVINFDDLLRTGGVLITTYGNGLADKVVVVKIEHQEVTVYLKD